MNLSVVILAAGSGTRMKSDTPKVLHKICGEELLFYSIECALELSDDVHIILYHQADKIRQVCEQRFPSTLSFHIQDHANFPGTGGALLQDKKLLSTKYPKLLILNGDMPLITPSSLTPFFSNSPISMGVIHSSNPFGYGRVILKEGRVQKIIEEKDATQDEKEVCTINSGIYCFDRDVLESYLPKLSNQNAQKEYYLTDVIKFASQDEISISSIDVSEEEFSGINDKSQLAQAQEIMLNRLRKKAMKDGVIMHLPHTIYLEKSVRFEGECEIEQGVQLLGKTLIQNSHIKAHSVIRDSQIISSDIGPMAHIRPKCRIENSHIGNFVEVKNSHLSGIKAGHLSYLGDSEIGEGSNIGAGVITCNYDGKTKHKTLIGKNVFVGSDCQLIAPLKLADHTLIGAGSTVRKDSKEGDLVISRSDQKNIADGFFMFFKEKK
ncbi:bifunctional UDP-N-acetylglucosamine diphosphorylase/glucosamine-1-phosphate N-acetyltransferase GlmU [Helicobacter pametensis]|uniref:bifunctional UDP-N-acetylglucosamine diphosphorylase/glucosamine-1-phosphate N-acetyltransferase GlmU n=1 Tax=Helicobacter pametensis TaxID=95149 RepID=UPI000482C4C9|nr:bifunctional UDP-N-acetylglucosamine diphosphorylase/glucosamine-1-phosphate N-acetyltransferase GlmU [Helicobacter pametensis]